MKHGLRAATLIIGLSALPGCDTNEVVIVTLASDAGSLGGSDAGPDDSACTSQAECGIDEYCRKATCDAPYGGCARRPTICDREPSPVCGCDGITYFNDCLRTQNGVAAATPGDCTRETALRCGGRMAIDCPASSFCAQLVLSGLECPVEPIGTCWVVPECDREAPRGGERFVPCGTQRDPPNNDDDECVDACTAIRSEAPHVRRFRCDSERGRGDVPSRTGM